VNLDHVTAFRRYGKGQLLAELDDGTAVLVSRNRAKSLRGLAV
jgi:DNA-binding LytR/AlgR family response regulator